MPFIIFFPSNLFGKQKKVQISEGIKDKRMATGKIPIYPLSASVFDTKEKKAEDFHSGMILSFRNDQKRREICVKRIPSL